MARVDVLQYVKLFMVTYYKKFIQHDTSRTRAAKEGFFDEEQEKKSTLFSTKLKNFISSDKEK